MYNISSNYQLNFKALVPKASYSGKPKFPEQVINELNRLKKNLTDADREILQLENDINNPDNRGNIVTYLERRLDELNSYREKLADLIAEIKEKGFFDYKDSYKMDKKHTEALDSIETDFARATRRGYWI